MSSIWGEREREYLRPQAVVVLEEGIVIGEESVVRGSELIELALELLVLPSSTPVLEPDRHLPRLQS